MQYNVDLHDFFCSVTFGDLAKRRLLLNSLYDFSFVVTLVQTRSTSVMKQLTRIQELSSLSHKIPGLTTQAHNEQVCIV